MDRLCQHFGVCGGCAYQDIPYDEQLKQKESVIARAIQQQNIDIQLSQMHPSARQWFYRNKMEFAFGESPDGVVCGLHAKGKHYQIIPLKECRISSEDVSSLLAAVIEEARQKRYPAYNKYTHEGFLRHLVLKESKTYPQIMINLVTTSQGVLDTAAFVERISRLGLKKSVVSIVRTINDSHSDAVLVERQEQLFGCDYIIEEVADLKYMITPQSFFQVNPLTLPQWYKRIAYFCRLQPAFQLLDLYCGIGGIGLYVSRYCRSVWGIELSEEAVKNASQNAQLNKISNVSFMFGDTAAVLLENAFFKGAIDAMTINPPRSGISNKVIKRVLEIQPATIVYSSCNPSSFFSDARRIMEQSRYTLESVEAFDFFPHTPHVEVVGVLRK